MEYPFNFLSVTQLAMEISLLRFYSTQLKSALIMVGYGTINSWKKKYLSFTSVLFCHFFKRA